MNFKLLASALVLMGTVAASAQSAEDLRVYINPGHGSWTGNDRPMRPIGHEEYTSEGTDTTSFFESNTDLIKGFGVLEKLIEYGIPFDRTLNQTGERWEIGAARDLDQNLVMSRVKNGPYHAVNDRNQKDWQYYNRDLYEICCEVEENDFDQFISIHSNAAGSAGHNNVNYHLLMYRGKNGRGGEAVQGSYDICEITANHSFANEHAQWSESKVYINGETDFMGHGSGSTNGLGYYGYLGVMKHGCPGYLVEGFFHTYTPSMHRAMNFDVDLIEGYLYARGVADYFQLETTESTGEIYGIVRDAHSSFMHDLWVARSGSEDVLMPLNGCSVTLKKDGKTVKEYTTDNYYNGAFVFVGLEPGMYQMELHHPDYMESGAIDIEVKAGETAYPKIYLTDLYYNGRPGEEMNYANPLPDSYTLDAAYDMSAGYQDVAMPIPAGFTAKRMVYNKDKVYILAKDAELNSRVIVVEAHSGTVLRTLVPEVAEPQPGTLDPISDIQVTGAGVLVACSRSLNQIDDSYVKAGQVRGYLTFYTWENDADGLPAGQPKQWLTTEANGQWYTAYMGDSFVFRGNLDDGEIIVSAINTSKATTVRTMAVEIADGQFAPNTENKIFRESRMAELVHKDYVDGDFSMVLSPCNRHQFFVTGNTAKYGIREYDVDHTISKAAISSSPSTLGTLTSSAGFFKYGSSVAMTFATNEGGVKLYNITRGLSSAEEVALNNAAVEGTASRILTTGYPVVMGTDAEGNPTDACFDVLVLRDGKLSRFTSSATNGIGSVAVDSDANAPVIFYDLNGRRVEGNLDAGIYIRLQGTTATKVYVK